MSDRPPEEAQRWRRAVEDGVFGVWDLDIGGEAVHYSPAWKARLGFPRIHAPDSTGFWRCRVHPDDFEPMFGALRSHVEGRSRTYEGRFRLRSNGSGYRSMLSRGRVVARDAQGRATRMVGTMVDLTDRQMTAAPQALAAEDPRQPVGVLRTAFHALLGVAGPLPAAYGAAGEHDALRLVDQVADLLDKALHEGSASRQRCAGQPVFR